MDTIESITKKVAGLLKLAERAGTPAEAEAAASKAAALMEQFGIERDIAIATSNEKEEAPEVYGSDAALISPDQGAKYIPQWKQRLGYDLMRLHGCMGYTSRNWRTGQKTFAIVGRPSDVATVRYLFAYIIEQCKRLTEEYGKGRGKSWCTDFRLGLVRGVTRAIQQAQAEQRSMAIDEAEASSNPNALVVINKALERRATRVEEAEAVLAREGIKLRAARSVARDHDFGAVQAGIEASVRVSVKSEAKGSLGAGRKAIKG